VISPATDVSVPTLAYVAQELGLPGPPLDAAEVLCDKADFRAFQVDRGLPVPAARHIRSKADIDPSGWDGSARLLKPTRSSGCKGVFIVQSPAEARRRLPETLAFSLNAEAVLETYIDGFQGTLEGVLNEGRTVLSFFLDRQTAQPPYVTTTGHHVPSRLDHRLRCRVMEQVEAIWELLNVRSGPFDCDFVATDSEVYILEMTPRIGGNSIAYLLREAAGFDIVACGIRHACGDAAELPETAELSPAALVLLGVDRDGLLEYDAVQCEAMRNEPWVSQLEFDVHRGRPVEAFINGRHRVGQALVVGPTRDDVDERVDELRRRLGVRGIPDA
jgi:biotin carboxylase